MVDPAQAPPSLLELTAYLLSRTGKDARTRVADRLAADGLRLHHHAALAALADFGPHTQRELAARLRLDPSDLAKAADLLDAAGWIDRTRDPADRRRLTLTLTPAGRTRLAELQAGARAAQDELLAPLDPAERTTLHVLLLRLHAGAAEQQG
ncbi:MULTISPECIES: MarR family transcriptional regulator [Kitasatospora]|uniref:Putative MarR family transcriptional regulator n=1 Tax=Kitasatospora setae (strain ATCC 33774 / DSM 43861 / JCM 3304 / KCC A-0304 / NBRC 14216 / KM-6054) TaxID=452652 RepID=E4N636_KITSK|nr:MULTISPECIES: MarR family transcriptional regulator [Kitasatospora]BAJ26667.1 putative MarR family transcriptional regulator [Kitasatospora setae KM-6054]